MADIGGVFPNHIRPTAPAVELGFKTAIIFHRCTSCARMIMLDGKKYKKVYIIAENGRAGLALASTFLPDLILVDLSMPEMDGFQLIEAAKQSPVLRDTAIILLTAMSNPENLVSKGVRRMENQLPC